MWHEDRTCWKIPWREVCAAHSLCGIQCPAGLSVVSSFFFFLLLLLSSFFYPPRHTQQTKSLSTDFKNHLTPRYLMLERYTASDGSACVIDSSFVLGDIVLLSTTYKTTYDPYGQAHSAFRIEKAALAKARSVPLIDFASKS